MPTTVNGVGTHYYGKRNRENRNGRCQACGRVVTLESYDTRLWFVILFVPIIPLKKKRIIDRCPVCSRHWAMNKDEWEAAKKTTIAENIGRYEAQPSPEVAQHFHAQLLSFRMFPEARRFREEALYQFSDSANLHAGMAVDLEAMDHGEEALPLYETALRLNPELPEARVGAGRARIQAGRLEEARDLLRFLERPGASQRYSLAPLEELAHAYQLAGKHEQTIEIGRFIMAELPQVARSRQFRKFLATSEKAVGTRESIVPRQRFSLGEFLNFNSPRYAPWQRFGVLGTIVIALLVTILLTTNEYRRRNRILRVINGLGAPVQVVVDSGPPIMVDKYGEIKIAEGSHHIKYAGPIDQDTTIDVRTNYFDRWSRKPVWILNPGGAGAVYHQKVFYQAQPTLQPETAWYIGEPFIFLPHVDYPFAEPPDTLQLPSENSIVEKTCIQSVNLPPHQLVYIAAETKPIGQAMNYAEARLSRWHQDVPLLNAYWGIATSKQQTERARDFLKRSLFREPLSIAWHRTYVQLVSESSALDELGREYELRLQSDPNNSTLLYLRSVVAPNVDEALQYIERARQSDPNLPWPYLDLSWIAAYRADWAAAAENAQKASALALQDATLEEVQYLARLGKGETAEIINENLSLVALASPAGLKNVLQICEACVVQGNNARALQEFSSYKTRLIQNGSLTNEVNAAELLVFYMTGDFERKPLAGVSDGMNLYLQTQLLVKQPAAVFEQQLMVASSPPNNPWDNLSIAIAFHLAGDDQQAREWIDKASSLFSDSDPRGKAVRLLLVGPDAPDMQHLEELSVLPRRKSLLLCALAVRFPERQKEYCEFAARLNVSRLPPYHLVQRMTEKVLSE